MRKETAERVLSAINQGIKGRRRLLVPIVGLALLLASSTNPNIEFTEAFKGLPVAPKPISAEFSLPHVKVSPDAYDYCKPITTESPPAVQQAAGIQKPAEATANTPIKNPLSEINSLDITARNIVTDNRWGDLNKLQVVLLPTNYDAQQLKPRMDYLTEALRKIYRNEVDFSYLDISVPLTTEPGRGIFRLDEQSKEKKNRLVERIGNFFPVDRVIIVDNSSRPRGGCCPPVVAGNSRETLYDIVHETGHEIGNLYDGYIFNYEPDRIFPSEVLFRPNDVFSSRIREVFNKLNPPIVYTGNRCEEQAVYTVYSLDNIMAVYKKRTDKQILDSLERGEEAFNPVQKELIRLRSRDFIEERKFNIFLIEPELVSMRIREPAKQRLHNYQKYR